jgi:predicted membrane protein
MNGPPEFPSHRHWNRQPTPLSGILVSVLIIVAGAALLTENLGLFRFRDFWTYAPALLVAFGVVKVAEARGQRSGSIFGGIVAAIGMLWLLDNLDIIHFSPGLIWPMIIIGFGVSALVKALDRHRGGPAIAADGSQDEPSDGPIHLQAFFGGNKRNISSAGFRGGDAVSMFGGIELDLRQAGMAGRRGVLDITVMFGGVEIKVPTAWNVTTQAFSIFGGVEDKSARNMTPGAPELVITGTVMFGGISVKN